MLYVIHCRDKKDHLSVRMETRPDHVEHLKSLGEKLIAAGPLLDADEKPCGSTVIIEADDLASAEAFATNDPYAKAGLFEQVQVDPWNKVLP